LSFRIKGDHPGSGLDQGPGRTPLLTGGQVMLENLTLQKAIAFAIKTEELGGRFYQRLEKTFSTNAELKAIFSALARDEATHEKQFRTLLERIPSADQGLSFDQEQYLRAMAISEVFKDEKGLNQHLDQIKTAEDALERALNMEKATLLYYLAMKEILGTEPLLEAIISAEKQHALQISRYLITGSKMRGLSDPF
jgi:rubrerythrin